MEFNEFDKLVQSKVGEAKPHQAALKEAQPYVWTAVQNEISTQKKQSPWWYIAAAAILLLFGLGGLYIWQLQNDYQSQLALLQSKVVQLEVEKEDQKELIGSKQTELSFIKQSLLSLEAQLKSQTTLRDANAEIASIQKDTIYIERTVYIEKELETSDLTIAKVEVPESENENTSAQNEVNRKVAIYAASVQKVTPENTANKLSVKLAQLSKP